ncbi:Zinc finger protein [Armadillidium nasatum]|uniref:Zinc finger protein n=1 Tax=Armadillidium nasatum TaxID=96803 RepID=A0A5N5TFF2_9CRUS|nr:Zinc finger protein [Armadillidium nasatum]
MSSEISPSDGLPDQICGPCIAKLDEIVEFSNKCLKVQSELQTLLNDKNANDVEVKPEPFEESGVGNDSVKISEEDKSITEGKCDNPAQKNSEICDENETKFVMSLIEDKSKPDGEFSPSIKPKTKKFKCTKCSKAYFRNTSLQTHIRRAHDQNMEKCPKCKKVFKSYELWTKHQRTHNKSTPYVCEVCSKSFSSRTSLKRHHETHTTPLEQRYKHDCPICGKKFTTKNVIRAHMKLHTDGKNFMCDQCGKSFQTKGTLQVHYRSHTGEKPYECDVCGMKYANIKPFKTHQLKHKEIRPYVCPQCSKAFYSPDLLRRHSFIHTDTRPYPCSFCSKRFRNQWKRKVHERIHTGEKPYKCTLCPSAFYESGNLQKHCRNVHHQDYRLQHQMQENQVSQEQHMYANENDQHSQTRGLDTHEVDDSYVTGTHVTEADIHNSNPLLGHTIFSSSVEMLQETELPI